MRNIKTIKVGISENDLQDLINGEHFVWKISGQEVYIYNEDRDLLCTEDDCFDLQGEDGEFCKKHSE